MRILGSVLVYLLVSSIAAAQDADSCRRENERIEFLLSEKTDAARDELKRFAREEMRCERLKPTVEALLAGMGARSPFDSFRLHSAEIFIRTGADGKDTTTAFSIEVWSKDGKTLIAHLKSEGACASECNYASGSDKYIELTVGSKVTRVEADEYVVKWCYEPTGRDDWDIAMSLLRLVFTPDGGEGHVVSFLDRGSRPQQFTNRLEGNPEAAADSQKMLAGFCKIY